MGKFLEWINLVEQVDVQEQDNEHAHSVCDHPDSELPCLGSEPDGIGI